MQYAIGAFNVSNLEAIQAVIWAAEAQRSPVIIQTSEGAIEYGGLKQLAAMVKSMSDETSVPVVLHLDHGHSLDMVQECIEAGYTSVMIDASTKSLAENTHLTQEIVEYAHKRGVWVEAELGTILGSEGAKQLESKTPNSLLTNPKEAKDFVVSTDIDALAVSVGTIHGAFSGREYIRFELLEEIEKTVPRTPLVIHGASGIADEHLQRVAATNVCKINIDTELRIAFQTAVQAYFKTEHDKVDPRHILGPAREAMQLIVEQKMKVFGSQEKI